MKTTTETTSKRTQPCLEQWALMSNNVRAEYLAEGFADPSQPMKTTTLQPAALGYSISHATLRTEDLLEAFTDELDWQLRRNGHFFSLPENFALRDQLNLLVGEAQDCWNDDGDGINPEFEDIAEELINESFPDALQTFAPPYCYFGAHEGDGADFGYWPSCEAIAELETVEGSDAARELGEDCKSVNDHGNVTVWNGNGEAILELV